MNCQLLILLAFFVFSGLGPYSGFAADLAQLLVTALDAANYNWNTLVASQASIQSLGVAANSCLGGDKRELHPLESIAGP